MALENALGMTDEEFLKQDLSMLEMELDEELDAQETNEIDEPNEEQTSDGELIKKLKHPKVTPMKLKKMIQVTK